MRKIFLLIVIVVGITNSMFAGWGFFELSRSYIQINFKGTETWYTVYDNGSSTFNGANLGILSADSDILKISSWDVKTWKSDDGNVTDADIYWRIYKNGTTPPESFNNGDGEWIQNLDPATNQKWGSSIDIDIDISSLDAISTYKLEIYITASGDNPSTTISDNNSGSNYIATFTTDAAFPVELSSFSASISDRNINLNWATATEINNYGFDVERSQDKTNWNKVTFVEGHGNSNTVRNYSFTDKSVTQNGNYYYRLKQIDNNGNYEYSNIVEVTVNNIPAKFELTQNFPNPFNPTTKISYGLPEATNVKLSVFNAIGQEVMTLNEGYKEAGNYTVEFNGSNLNSGIYFYKLEAGSNSQIKKMILIK